MNGVYKLMKINWKVLIAAVLIIVVGVWTVDTVRSRSFSGSDLNVATGHGIVTVTNSATEAVPVQLTSIGTRGFSVSSTDGGVTGVSTRQGSGRTATQLLEFALPPGHSSFTVVSNSVVSFVANSTSRLDVTVQPMSENELRTTLIVAAVAILLALFYISHATGHRLVRSLLQRPAEKPLVPTVSGATDAMLGQGQAIRSYGDNRSDISER